MEPPADASEASTPRPRVLVVDDERLIRDTVADILAEEGYEPLVAEHGAAALALLRDADASDHPCLILLDMLMPVMDGWAFAREYRAMPGPHAPIVVMTAAHDCHERAAQVAAAGVLPKPFDLMRLLELADRFARGWAHAA